MDADGEELPCWTHLMLDESNEAMEILRAPGPQGCLLPACYSSVYQRPPPPSRFGFKTLPHGVIVDWEGVVEYNHVEFRSRLQAMLKAQEMFRGVINVEAKNAKTSNRRNTPLWRGGGGVDHTSKYPHVCVSISAWMPIYPLMV